VMIKTLLVAITLLCSGIVYGQGKPDAPKPNKTIEIITDTVLAGAAAYDWKTTSDAQHDGMWEGSSAWAIGHRPNDHKIILFSAAFYTSEVVMLHFTERSHHKLIRWAGRAYTSFAVEEHIRLGIHNSNLRLINK